MGGQLVVVAGPDQGKSFAVSEGQTLVLGRGQASDTQINDPHLSRVHCRVELKGGIATLSDAGSSGGTFVNGEKIEQFALTPGTTFRVGNTDIQYQAAATEEPTLAGQVSPVAVPAGGLENLVGTTFAHFRMDEILARTASGTVFKGTDTEKDRVVAIKVLEPNPTESEEQRDRFVRAMRTMMPIRHPNIVRLYHAGKNGPYCWAAMQFVDGESLTAVIERIGVQGMLDWTAVFPVAVDICRALEEAHDRKIIHRNLTPANVLKRHSDGVCLISDLMLAKAQEGTLAAQVTRPGRIVGNLNYLPPERTSDEMDADHRSDLYGLGATLYALLTGRPPFESKSMPELIRLVREGDVAPPKDFQLSVNDGFQDIVMQLLRKEREERYQEAAEVMRDLERVARFNGLSIDRDS